jgi:hypothetical protein
MCMMEGTHEEIKDILVENTMYQLQGGRPYIFRFKANQDLDFVCVGIAQSICFRIEVIEQLYLGFFGMFVFL